MEWFFDGDIDPPIKVPQVNEVLPAESVAYYYSWLLEEDQHVVGRLIARLLLTSPGQAALRLEGGNDQAESVQ